MGVKSRNKAVDGDRWRDSESDGIEFLSQFRWWAFSYNNQFWFLYNLIKWLLHKTLFADTTINEILFVQFTRSRKFLKKLQIYYFICHKIMHFHQLAQKIQIKIFKNVLILRTRNLARQLIKDILYSAWVLILKFLQKSNRPT